jgi:AAA15 family ATPase/GTPase
VEHFLKNITIQTFKSIQHLEIKDCNKINLFIGPPNVGKSNILEALSLFDVVDVFHNKENQQLYRDIKGDVFIPHTLDRIIRIENLPDLFYLGDISKYSVVSTNQYVCQSKISDNILQVSISGASGNNFSSTSVFSKDLKFKFGSVSVPYSTCMPKLYKFSLKTKDENYEVGSFDVLNSPFGENITEVIQYNSVVKKEIFDFLKFQGVNLIFDTTEHKIRIILMHTDNVFFTIPYSSIADTLQRIIFYKTAVKSNKYSILLFEEPEANCYPPYIKALTQDIVESNTNQFFIATHSDIVVNHFLENAFNDTMIYMVDFLDGQTVVQSLTEQQKLDIVTEGIDIFFNRDYFLTTTN